MGGREFRLVAALGSFRYSAPRAGKGWRVAHDFEIRDARAGDGQYRGLAQRLWRVLPCRPNQRFFNVTILVR